MSYQEILEKKFSRLSKFTGKKFRRKQLAYNLALARHGFASEKPVMETAEPEYKITTQAKTFFVRASNEKRARARAREALQVRALPVGTKVEKF